MAAREGYAELQARVLEARRVWKRTLFWTGCAIAVVGLIAILAGAAIVDLLMPLPGSVRIALLVGIAGAVGYLLYRHLIQPLRVKLTPHDVALNVERKHQDLEGSPCQRPSVSVRWKPKIRSNHICCSDWLRMLWNGLKESISRQRSINVKNASTLVLRLLCSQAARF